MRADRAQLIAGYDFPLDRFQLAAFDALDDGRHVVVAAPTGSGKTVVAEYGIAACLADGSRSFYTAPIKALSNQKYRDLCAIHGDEAVGLLTGDNAINGDAPIVVMTTEVLRNMIYAHSRSLHDLGLVVLDEVHFLQDTYRGPVWEEVIIHLPRTVTLCCLSATVSNTHELAEWITTVRGETTPIIEDRRPVRLVDRYLVADRTADRLRLFPTFVNGAVNRDALKLDESGSRRASRSSGGGQRAQERRALSTTRGAARRRLATPGRVETVERLASEGLLPAIHFIFSRAQCDEAARACLDAGLVLTAPGEQDAIDDIADQRLGELDPGDLEVLGVDRYRAQLRAGIAAHHAGMVPAMKEVVEQCFTHGLIKVVFATETLAVGINMPARSVVIEKLTKFTGDHHERLTPGEYTQLTGRAGRRGIDEVGDAIVLWSPWVPFAEVAELAGSSTFHLRSAFRPTYNMAANLVQSYTDDEAHRLLGLSFGQFQADRDVVRLEARIERRLERLAEMRADATSPYGDIDQYRRRAGVERTERTERRRRSAGEVRGALVRLRPGSVVGLANGSHRGPAVVVATAHRKAGVRLTLVSKDGRRFYATADDFAEPPRAIGHVRLPEPFAPNRRSWLADVGRRLRRANLNGDPYDRATTARRADADTPDAVPADLLPVAADPELSKRLRAAAQADRVESEIDDLRRRVSGKRGSLAADFDRVLAVLDHFDYVDVDEWLLTENGHVLVGIFHESDLLVAECVRSGILDDLPAPDVAAMVSCLVYEHRSPEPPPSPWFSSRDVRSRWKRMAAISEDLAAQERSVGLTPHRSPDPTFAAVAHGWVAGEGFADVVADEDLTGGDFVRNVKQLIDLLRQLAIVAPDPGTRRAAAMAADEAFRGVVADSSVTVPT